MADIEYLEGIDVSHHQGEIDWEYVASTIDFAIIRGGFGNANYDKMSDQNIKGCNDYGIPFGLYWFSYAINANDARIEADYLISLAEDYLKKIKLRNEESMLLYPLIFDWEYDSAKYYKQQTGKDIDKTTFNLMCQAFCERIEEAGYYAMVYVNEDYRKNYLSKETSDKHDIWYARYGSKMYNDYHLHQYSATGKVGGITGEVDLDRDYLNFPELITSKGLNHVNDNKRSVDYVLLYSEINNKLGEALSIETDESKRNVLKMLQAHVLEGYQKLRSLA